MTVLHWQGVGLVPEVYVPSGFNELTVSSSSDAKVDSKPSTAPKFTESTYEMKNTPII